MRVLMRKGFNAIDDLPIIVTWWGKPKYVLKVWEGPPDEIDEPLPDFSSQTFCDSCCKPKDTVEVEITSYEGSRRLEVCSDCLAELSEEAHYTTGTEINIVK